LVLQLNVQALETQAGDALAMLVVQTFPHVLQSLTLLVVSTHVPPQFICPEAHPPTHVEFAQLGVEPLHAIPHLPQLFLSLVVSTQAPLHSVKPLLHVKPHVLPLHVGLAFATLVEQTLPHVLQLLRSFVVSTHAPPQSVGVAAGQPEMHALTPESGPASGLAPQTGVEPEHAIAQPPQLDVVLSCAHAPLQGVYPGLQVTVHALRTQAGCPLATLGQAFPHIPQLAAVLVVSTHEPLQIVVPDGQPLMQV
jgi:hypothetical protein